MNWILHYNKNHDKLGRFAKSTNSKKESIEILNDYDSINKTLKPVNDYVNKMSKEDYDNLMLGETEDYVTDAKYIMTRVMKKIGDKPVSVFDIYNDKHETNVAIATDPKHYGKGYGSEVSKIGMEYINKNRDKFRSTVVWGVAERNKASRHLAEKNGFKLIPNSDWEINGINTLLYEKKVK